MKFNAMDSQATLQPDVFRNPGAEFRPVMMWLWNNDIDPVTLREQIADMAAKGVGGFFIHPMPDSFRKHDFVEGIKEPYPGDAFLGWVKAASGIAREYGLFCWLYDEGGWPSGTVTGTLVKNHPEIAAQTLRVQRLEENRTDQTGESVITLPAAGGPLRFYASREGSTDLMNPATADAFLAATHERYHATLGTDFGTRVPGMFTDEASVNGAMGSERIPWTTALAAEFLRRKGYDLLPFLPLLFSETVIPAEVRKAFPPGKAARVRYDFGDVWTQLHADSFYGRLHAWCAGRNLLLLGHVGGEDDLANHATRLFGHFFRIMRHLDIPGVDAIWRQLFPGQPHLHFSKFASSAAHVEGKRLAISESFAVYGYGLTFADMKWVTDRQYGDGINLMAPMAAHYASSRGRAFCTMSNLAWGNPTWRLFKGYADYVGRLSYLLRLGRPTARVAVLYPAGSLWAEGQATPIVESFHAVTDLLQEAQIDFDYVDEDRLLQAEIKDGAVRLADQAYQALVLSRSTIMPRGLPGQMQTLCRQGGAVVAVDSLPSLCAEESGQQAFESTLNKLFQDAAGRARFLATGERGRLAETVGSLIQRDFVLETPNPDIRYSHRILGQDHLYFIVNASAAAQAVVATLAGAGAAEIWNPDPGTISGARAELIGERTRVSLALPPLGAVFLILRSGGKTTVPPLPTLRSTRPLEGPWEIAPVCESRLAQCEPRLETTPLGCENWQPAGLGPWASLGRPDFSGSMAYRCSFGLSGDEALRSVWLDLGGVKHAAEVTINGRLAGVRLWPPYALEVTGLLRPGQNDVRIVVTNTWANQFLKPETINYARERGWYNVYAQRAEPFERESLESGLLGPVRLVWGDPAQPTSPV